LSGGEIFIFDSPPSLTRKRTGARGKEIMMLLSRRTFFKLTGASTIGWYAATRFGWVQRALAQIRCPSTKRRC
jgi:hypothetical protein